MKIWIAIAIGAVLSVLTKAHLIVNVGPAQVAIAIPWLILALIGAVTAGTAVFVFRTLKPTGFALYARTG